METLKTMTCRKSVRSYKNTLSDADLQKILLAAQASPIGMGKYDTMHMTVVRNAELLQELDRNAAEFFGDSSKTPLYGPKGTARGAGKTSGRNRRAESTADRGTGGFEEAAT